MVIFKKEKKVVDLVLSHVTAVDDCLNEARSVLESYIKGDLESARAQFEQVGQLESKADSLEREIRNVLFAGAFLPEVRADIYLLIDEIDSVAGQAEAMSSFIVVQSPLIPEEFTTELVEICSVSVASFYEFSRAVKTFLKPKGKFEKLQERSNRVSLLESEVDEHARNLAQRIFDSELDFCRKIHLAQLLELTAAIADRTEDAAESLVVTALKSAI